MIKNFISIDLEMTGLSPERDKILEIGVVEYNNGKITKLMDTLVNPNILISDKITKITGINNSSILNKPYIEDVIEELLEIISDKILIGHNIKFDYSFICQAAFNLGIFPLHGSSYSHNIIDTLHISKKLLPDIESHKLINLCKHYNIYDKNHHRAYNDAEVTARLYECLCEEYMEKKDINNLIGNNDKNISSNSIDITEMIEQIIYKPKKQVKATTKTIEFVASIEKYHGINSGINLNQLTQSEANRYVDALILKYGRIK